MIIEVVKNKGRLAGILLVEDLVTSLEKIFFMLVTLPDSGDIYLSERNDNDSAS